ncbi:MAG: TlpA family protein disulfide reductase [Verrucomicrobiia bacterium]|jgi:thiol-disulfide isomerase/thioredoxin
MRSRGFLILLICVGCAFLTQAAPSPDLENSDERFAINEMHGKVSPDWKLKGWLNSRALKLPELKGRIVVLDFWATWCAECVRAIPKLNALQNKYASKGVVIVGVCATDGSERIAEVVKSRGITYPVAIDSDGITNQRYKANSSPDYYIIDRDGKLRWGDFANRHLEKAIQILLAEEKRE